MSPQEEKQALEAKISGLRDEVTSLRNKAIKETKDGETILARETKNLEDYYAKVKANNAERFEGSRKKAKKFNTQADEVEVMIRALNTEWVRLRDSLTEGNLSIAPDGTQGGELALTEQTNSNEKKKWWQLK